MFLVRLMKQKQQYSGGFCQIMADYIEGNIFSQNFKNRTNYVNRAESRQTSVMTSNQRPAESLDEIKNLGGGWQMKGRSKIRQWNRSLSWELFCFKLTQVLSRLQTPSYRQSSQCKVPGVLAGTPIKRVFTFIILAGFRRKPSY